MKFNKKFWLYFMLTVLVEIVVLNVIRIPQSYKGHISGLLFFFTGVMIRLWTREEKKETRKSETKFWIWFFFLLLIEVVVIDMAQIPMLYVDVTMLFLFVLTGLIVGFWARGKA